MKPNVRAVLYKVPTQTLRTFAKTNRIPFAPDWSRRDLLTQLVNWIYNNEAFGLLPQWGFA